MDSTKKEKLILLGKSGSGKDYLLRKLTEKGLKPGVKWTTRPPRKHEVADVSYKFVSEERFKNLISERKFICYQDFLVTPDGKEPETWYYGMTKEEFNSSQIFIMTPGEFSTLNTEQRKGCFVVYLDIDRKTRKQRIQGRGDKNDSVERRLDADEIDFKDFSDYDLRVTDPEFEADDIYSLME